MDKRRIFTFVDGIQKELENVSDSIFDYAETGFEEFQSSALLRRRLEENGFAIDDLSGKVPNAFLARFGSGRPVIAILAEFDALPGTSQVAGATRMQPNADPSIKGFHGCGHHIFAAGCLGGALAAAQAIQKNGLRGTVMFCACPAEEGGGGKTLMALEGAFDGVDCAITWHPDKMNAMRLFHTSALLRYDFQFRGQGAHAANEPENGRSALDAVELMDIGVNYLREHVPSTVRMHYAITNSGGPAANIVQAEAEVVHCIRSVTVDGLLTVADRIKDVARGAALMTGTTVRCRQRMGCVDIIPNRTLARVIYHNMELAPRPVPNAEDVRLSRELAKECPAFETPAEDGLLYETVLRPFTETEENEWGSGDTGDVSWKTPVAIFNATAFFRGTPGHSWQLAAQGKSNMAHGCAVYAAKVLGASAADLLENPALIESARMEWSERTSGKHYAPLTHKPFEKLI